MNGNVCNVNLEPADQEAFVTWSEGFDMSLKTEDITKVSVLTSYLGFLVVFLKLLSSDDVIRKLHTELVPHKVILQAIRLKPKNKNKKSFRSLTIPFGFDITFHYTCSKRLKTDGMR